MKNFKLIIVILFLTCSSLRATTWPLDVIKVILEFLPGNNRSLNTIIRQVPITETTAENIIKNFVDYVRNNDLDYIYQLDYSNVEEECLQNIINFLFQKYFSTFKCCYSKKLLMKAFNSEEKLTALYAQILIKILKSLIAAITSVRELNIADKFKNNEGRIVYHCFFKQLGWAGERECDKVIFCQKYLNFLAKTQKKLILKKNCKDIRDTTPKLLLLNSIYTSSISQSSLIKKLPMQNFKPSNFAYSLPFNESQSYLITKRFILEYCSLENYIKSLVNL